MTPVDELALAKLRNENFNFTPKEFCFLLALGQEYLDSVYSGERTSFPRDFEYYCSEYAKRKNL